MRETISSEKYILQPRANNSILPMSVDTLPLNPRWVGSRWSSATLAAWFLPRCPIEPGPSDTTHQCLTDWANQPLTGPIVVRPLYWLPESGRWVGTFRPCVSLALLQLTWSVWPLTWPLCVTRPAGRRRPSLNSWSADPANCHSLYTGVHLFPGRKTWLLRFRNICFYNSWSLSGTHCTVVSLCVTAVPECLYCCALVTGRPLPVSLYWGMLSSTQPKICSVTSLHAVIAMSQHRSGTSTT